MAENFEAFNQVVGLVFDQLYRSFPVSKEIDYDEIANKLGIEIRPYRPDPMFITTRTKTYGEVVANVDLESFTDEAVRFLDAEGFLQMQDRSSYRLSAKALELLSAPLPGLQKPAGPQIVELSKDLGNAAGRHAMGEVIGHVIGAAARGLMGGV